MQVLGKIWSEHSWNKGLPTRAGPFVYLGGMIEKSIEIPPSTPASDDADARPASASLEATEEQSLLRAAWGALPDASLLVHTATARVVLANPAACTLLGYSCDELRGMDSGRDRPRLAESRARTGESGSWIERRNAAASFPDSIANPQSPIPNPPSCEAMRAALHTRGGAILHVHCRLRPVAKPGDAFFLVVARTAGEEDGASDGRLATREPRRLRASDSRSQAPNPLSAGVRPPSDDRDALTGLPDRRHFENRLLAALRKARSRAEYHFAVLFVDLDGFKALNDTWGHLHGDRVLQDIAARLYACIRPQDAIARFGGDEFTVLVDNLHGPSDVVHVAERIQLQMLVPVEVEGHRATITASIGIALSWHGYRDPEAMLRDADRAMYQAKAEGKARYVVWTPEGNDE